MSHNKLVFKIDLGEKHSRLYGSVKLYHSTLDKAQAVAKTLGLWDYSICSYKIAVPYINKKDAVKILNNDKWIVFHSYRTLVFGKEVEDNV